MYNIKMGPKKLECDNVNYINLAHVGWWWSVLNTVTMVECSEHGNNGGVF